MYFARTVAVLCPDCVFHNGIKRLAQIVPQLIFTRPCPDCAFARTMPQLYPNCMQDTFARATHSAYAAARPSARATIGYLVYKYPTASTHNQLAEKLIKSQNFLWWSTIYVTNKLLIIKSDTLIAILFKSEKNATKLMRNKMSKLRHENYLFN